MIGTERGRGEIALVACAFVWGATFPAIKAALDLASPLLLITLRFGLAALVVAYPALRLEPAALRRALPVGIGLGVLLACAFAAQTLGLDQIGPSRSAFLTSFYVVLTPLCEWWFTGRSPTRRLWLAAVIALVGVQVMTGAGFDGAIGAGDRWTLACAALFAIHLTWLGLALGRHHNLHLLFLQVATCTVLGASCAPWLEAIRCVPGARLWLQVAFLGVAATVGVFWLQNYGQVRVSPTRAALLFATEPIWAALFSAITGDRLSGHEIGGAALVMAAVLLASGASGASWTPPGHSDASAGSQFGSS